MADCGKNKKDCEGRKIRSITTWFPAIVIALLPKCPFCIMAYSGAVTLCSGSKIYPNGHSIEAYFICGSAIFILMVIILNFKGVKTIFSIAIVLIGIMLLVGSQFMWMKEWMYYTGCIMLFFGIWVNGSFLHFYNRYFQNKFKNQFFNKLNKINR